MTEHKPISGALVPSPPAHAPTKPDARKTCLGCGEPEHGSVGVYIACLNAALVTARQETIRLRGLLGGISEALHKP